MLCHLHSYFLYVNTAETGGMWAREFFIDTTRSTTRITLQHESPKPSPTGFLMRAMESFNSCWQGWGWVKNNGFSVYVQERSCLYSPPKIREERGKNPFVALR